MKFVKFNLLLTSLLLIMLYFFLIPFYNNWLFTKVINPNNSAFDQMQHMDIPYRMEYRFGGSYLAYMDMARSLSKYPGVVLLLPPTDFLRTLNINDLDIAEPAEFYYFTGVTSVWASSPDANRANWAVTAAKGKGLNIRKVKPGPQLDSLIKLYKQYTK